ncbi:MAG TPA: FkbM family methyltransferase [Gammaproteobacteria bacterium]|nr:FkbM family methyltransferase [Gammaproteobacteria bacterium]
MPDAESKRKKILSRVKTSPLLAPMKWMVPDYVKTLILRLIAGGEQGTIHLSNGGMLKYNLDDSYWARYADDIRDYEPEIWFLLDRFLSADTIFIDCGANIGLWSCYAAHLIKNKYLVVAVEPGDSILPLLRQNHALNGRNFTLLERAVWNSSGESMSLMVYSGHASSSLVETDLPIKPLHRVSVQTVCIDDVVVAVLAKAPHVTGVVIKLDVEGAEQRALDGASTTLATRNTLLIYEDHGRDLNSETTAYFLSRGLNIYYIRGVTHAVSAVADTQELRAIKTDPGNGYNFIACRPGSTFDKDFSDLSR